VVEKFGPSRPARRWRFRAVGLAALRRALRSSCANALPLRCEGLLPLGIRDLEAVLRRQLHAHLLESLTSVDGERAPLLCAELKRSENSFSPVGIADMDLLAPIGEGRRAALADTAIVDAPTLDPRGEGPDVLGRRPLCQRE